MGVDEGLKEPQTPVERMERAEFDAMRGNLAEAAGNLGELSKMVEIAQMAPRSRLGKELMRIFKQAEQKSKIVTVSEAHIDEKLKDRGADPRNLHDLRSNARKATMDVLAVGQELDTLFSFLGRAYAWVQAGRPSDWTVSAPFAINVEHSADLLEDLPMEVSEELKQLPEFMFGFNDFNQMTRRTE